MRSKLMCAALLISSSADAGEAIGRHMEAAFDLVAMMSASCAQHYPESTTFPRTSSVEDGRLAVKRSSARSPRGTAPARPVDQ
jgi:hypothetical protein